LVRVKLSLEGFPDRTPLVIGQEVILPLAIQEGARLATEAFCHMLVLDTAGPSGLLSGMDMPARQFDNLGCAQESDQAVMVKVQG
jgi:hypothetical protein